MYATPLFYSPNIIPEAYRGYYNLNPMVSIITAFRDILYYKRIPALETLTLAIVLGLLILIIGTLLFNILNRRFAEEL
jgi:ABC-2 type transport system permease protein